MALGQGVAEAQARGLPSVPSDFQPAEGGRRNFFYNSFGEGLAASAQDRAGGPQTQGKPWRG